MDPRLMTILGNVRMAAAVGSEGDEGGAGRHDASEGDDAGADGDDEGDEDDDGDDGGEDNAGGGDEGDDADDEDEDEGDEDLGARAQKRIKKLIAGKKDAESRVKVLEKQLEEARKLSGDDGKAIMKAAERSGILPGLMSKAEAEAFASMDQYRAVIRNYENWLDNAEPDDAYETSDGKSMSYGKVERRVRRLKEELDELKEEFGGRRKDLEAKVRKIFEAGVEALKEGKKPAKAEKAKKKTEKSETRPKVNGPKPKGAGRGESDDIEVDDEDSLEAFIMAERRRRK